MARFIPTRTPLLQRMALSVRHWLRRRVLAARIWLLSMRLLCALRGLWLARSDSDRKHAEDAWLDHIDDLTRRLRALIDR